MTQRDSDLALSSQQLMDLVDTLHTEQSYRALSSPGLGIGTTAAGKVKIASTTVYLHDGVFKSKTTAEVAFTATVHDIPAAAGSIQEACYLVCLAADGTPSLVMGDIATGAGAAKLPEVSAYAGLTPIGYLRLAVAAGATDFNASTDELSAAHLTDTYVNLGYLAPRFDEVQ